jgi:hypothetical protein
MRQILPSIIFLAAIGVLYLLGSSLNCVSVGEFNQCWGLSDSEIESDLCSTGTCFATIEDQKYNAYISVLTDACNKAGAGSYQDEGLNSAIEGRMNEIYNLSTTPQEFCGNPVYLIYRQY